MGGAALKKVNHPPRAAVRLGPLSVTIDRATCPGAVFLDFWHTEEDRSLLSVKLDEDEAAWVGAPEGRKHYHVVAYDPSIDEGVTIYESAVCHPPDCHEFDPGKHRCVCGADEWDDEQDKEDE